MASAIIIYYIYYTVVLSLPCLSGSLTFRTKVELVSCQDSMLLVWVWDQDSAFINAYTVCSLEMKLNYKWFAELYCSPLLFRCSSPGGQCYGYLFPGEAEAWPEVLPVS